MNPEKASCGFRRKIKECLPFWQEQEFLNPNQAAKLATYYRLESLKGEMTHLFLTGVYLIGVFLIGIGVISFIAAHWTGIGREIKVVMLFAAMLAAHGAGFYLWQVSGTYPRLGHALIVLGTLIFGANIGLMAQIFHVRENPANGFLAWSLGAAAVAYALRSVPNALVAIAVSMIFFFMRAFEGHSDSMVQAYPFAATAFFIPLAYRCRSRWALWAVLLSLAVSIPFCFVDVDGNTVGIFILPILAGVAFTAWGLLNERSESTISFALPCKIAGFAMSFLFLYLLSFWELATELQDEYLEFISNDWTILLTAGTLCGIALILSVLAFADPRGRPAGKINLALLTISAVATMVLAAMDAYLLVVGVHILLLLLSANLIRISVQTQRRGLFWAGIWLPGLIILSRTLEYETELLIKAVIFAVCGVGVIAAGVIFERWLKRKGVADV